MQHEKTTVIVNRYGMGTAPEELSLTLVKNYLVLIREENMVPAYLKALESSGCKILICKTCLNFYALADKVAVGTVATMVDIIGAQDNSTKVITI